jgi:hypothetical protein
LPETTGGATITLDERRRIALHRAAAATWGEEVADTLVELVGPPGHEVATRADIDAALREQFAAQDARLDQRFAAQDARWDQKLAERDAHFGQKLETMEHRITAAFERRIGDAVSMQTRTLVFSQLGALIVIAALAFGLR